MNAAAVSQLPLSVPLLTIVLQGAAAGALIGSAVLCRARLRGLHVEPWSVTAAWSALGACAAAVYGTHSQRSACVVSGPPKHVDVEMYPVSLLVHIRPPTMNGSAELK